MANGHGGPRTPRNPAPVSGPGSLSRRTDGGPAQKLRPITGLPYGQNQELNAEQAAAPLAQTPGPGAAAPSPGSGPAMPPPPTPFAAPTERPNEPVTAGAALGPGPGPEALTGSPPGAGYQTALSTLQQVVAASGSDEAAALLSRMQTSN